ncbi:serine/threonine-protein kinase mph1 isoform X2 [Morus notabilis]|uniref:serine/threonine-protein kinase mph1 isoform X2 n=1 Tax=Morus notabilis TaxID=981085 RepID=UPI000CED0233|nr:serine/threonine-protein kinase mph1 isoform X2 [Morus notabilis]
MDREVNLPPTNLNPNYTSSSSLSSSSSPPDFLHHVQAAFKRHRSLGVMQSNSIGPRRTLVPQRRVSKSSKSNVGSLEDTNRSREVVAVSQGNTVKDSIKQIKGGPAAVKETQEDASITLPSISGTITEAFDESLNPFDAQRDQAKPITGPENNPQSQLVDGQKKVQFSVASEAISQEMERVTSNQGEASTVINHEMKRQNIQSAECDITSRSDGGVSSSLAKRTNAVQDQLHHFKNFLSQPITQSSVAGPSCATTTSVHSTSAPMLNQTTFCSRLHSNSNVTMEPASDPSVNAQPKKQGKIMQQLNPSLKDTSGMLSNQIAVAQQSSTSVVDGQMEVKEYEISKVQQGCMLKESGFVGDPSLLDDRAAQGKRLAADVINIQSQVPSSKGISSDMKDEPSKLDKQDKTVSGKGASVPRKRSYDPDLFFKVNGKLYQRLGKIGSGGSSEVHKVISSDCTIYALKKIKLRGRDYATAYGFCQEIEYLNRLKGKHNIIQLIDYEVTDSALLREVMNGSMSNKDGRVKDDGHIYMVLEYGEIDLAHMLCQRWKEIDGSKQTIDDNWLRFYWQQILLAVSTIHEERIVHSDLKPANFLLVKGSLKLIDFGIAKAIMSDTTNIQRDSQVGTLSYMSPEAFMCNENDANGNPIKCGRPSDIWSLGCILYQMVYGRTPFSDYKTFWAKFKVITDPNHEIRYEPVSNPWLLDIMKKCLAWDRSERWRIPQLLQHPFLVPPIPLHQSASQDQSCRLLQLISNACKCDTEALNLCSQLQELLKAPDSLITSQLLSSHEQQRKLLSHVSKLFYQLERQLASSEKE